MHIGIDARMAGVAQGGLGRYAEEVVRAFAHMNDDFKISLFVRKANWDLFALDGRFQKVMADVPWYGLREQIAMPQLFRHARCDVYHVPHFNVPLRMPRPFVCTLHDLIMWERGEERDTKHTRALAGMKAWTMKAVVRHALKHCETCVVPSQWAADRIEPVTGMRPRRVEVVYEGAETLRSVKSAAWDSIGQRYHVQTPYVLTVGNVYRHKNIPLVMEAVASLKGTFPSLLHIHAGPAHPKKFYALIVQYGRERLDGQFHHLGEVTDGELSALYRHAVAYVAPSRMEGFALPALEAMQAECPVIAVRAHCFPEILGDAAQYISVDDAAALADQISGLLTDGRKRAELIRRGTMQAAHYTWEKHAKGLWEIYHAI